jgi:hypothetical protein
MPWQKTRGTTTIKVRWDPFAGQSSQKNDGRRLAHDLTAVRQKHLAGEKRHTDLLLHILYHREVRPRQMRPLQCGVGLHLQGRPGVLRRAGGTLAARYVRRVIPPFPEQQRSPRLRRIFRTGIKPSRRGLLQRANRSTIGKTASLA